MDADRMAGIRNMGRLVDSDWETSQELMDFQTYLNTYDANDTYYDTNAHMRSVWDGFFFVGGVTIRMC